jgi:hypothetical protein
LSVQERARLLPRAFQHSGEVVPKRRLANARYGIIPFGAG